MDQVSIVIPTQKRMPALSRTLAALSAQELDGLEAELVVVCSGISPSDREEVREAVSGVTLPAQVLARADGGPAGARNAGADAAAGDVILFLNEDTPPLSRDLVKVHATIHSERSDDLLGVLGPVVWDPEIEPTPVMDWLARTGKMNDYSELSRDGSGASTLYAPNFSLRRSAFISVGGFDERFWRYGWEEYDLALRLADRGFRTEFVPAVVAAHHHRYTTKDSLTRMEAVGSGASLLNRVHRSRDGLATPSPAGLKARLGRAIAPLAVRVPVPAWLPRPLRDLVFRVQHFSVLARGYANAPG